MAVRRFSLEEIAALCRGRVSAPSTSPVTGLCLDSRFVRPGCLFAALKGERSDGHDFCAAAVEAGAVAILAEREVAFPAWAGVVLVPSVEKALWALASQVRSEYGGEVVGVVGSCGKTTTKDFTAEVLSTLGQVCATPGNRNNLLGLPETLLNADLDARFWVLELGISKPGEMEELAPIAGPTGVVITTIQPVHTEFFPSLEAIRDEKAKVFRWTSPSGFGVLNWDDPLLRGLPLPETMRRITYGTLEGAGLRIEALGTERPEGTAFLLHKEGSAVRGFLPMPGAHNLSNFAAACATGDLFGMPLGELAAAAERMRPASHRGEKIHLRGDVFLLDESYNANPAAMATVLRSMAGWGERRRVAALGEMLELGPARIEQHKNVGQLAAEMGVARLLAVGGEGAKAMGEAFSGRDRRFLYVPHWRDGAEWLEAQLEDGDGLLVKGSRSVGLDGLVKWLCERRGL